jgi:hypothetical protein
MAALGLILFPTKPIPRRQFWTIGFLLAATLAATWLLPELVRTPGLKILTGPLSLVVLAALVDQVIQRYRDAGVRWMIPVIQALAFAAGFAMIIAAGLASFGSLFGGTPPGWTGPVGVGGFAIFLVASFTVLVVCCLPSRFLESFRKPRS